MSKATVKAVRFGTDAETASGWEYSAHHRDCGWFENLAYWHNAFWAADHHVRYDCGKREPSSGGYVLDLREAKMTTEQEAEFVRRWNEAEHSNSPSFTVHMPTYYQPMSTEVYEQKQAEAQAMAPFMEQAGQAMDRWLNEGGMQNDPTPSDMGDPLPPGYAEASTVELGAITTEVGTVEWEGRHLEGWQGNAGVGSAGWWARVLGRHGRPR
jgi:hypothetical protein